VRPAGRFCAAAIPPTSEINSQNTVNRQNIFSLDFSIGRGPTFPTPLGIIADPTPPRRQGESATGTFAKIASESQHFLLASQALIGCHHCDFFVVLPAIVITLKP
jgi:hypothetical protein